MTALVWIAGGYLLGSIPFSLLIARRLGGVDLRQVGSGNPGATNVLRAAGVRAAILALGCDVAKGALPVLLGRAVGLHAALLAGLAVAAVGGHVYSVFLGFRGGKGVATASGALAALLPAVTVLAAVVFILVVATTRYVSLGSVTAAVAVALLGAVALLLGWLGPDRFWAVGASTLIAAMVVAQHRENLVRLRAGTEARLGGRAGGG